MKIYIENLKPNMSPFNGKGKFIQRLAKQFKKDGHTILSSPEKCDINFRMNAMPSTSHGKSVVRLDNIRYSNEPLHVKNDANDMTRDTMKKADGIVFQSELSQRLCMCVLCAVPNRSAVIYNGVDPKEFKPERVTIEDVSYMMAFQIIHPMRRIELVADVWNRFASEHKGVTLFLFSDKKVGVSDIAFLETVLYDAKEQQVLNNFMYYSSAIINMTYQDSCPNMVIEALACGTHSIIGESNGISHILPTYRVKDAPMVSSMQGWENPPPFDDDDFYSKLCQVYDNPKPKVDFPEEFHIKNTAKSYIKFFEEVLS